MSRRPWEWHLLGRGGADPVPGSPSSVERLANEHERAADEVARLSGRLRRLAALDGMDALGLAATLVGGRLAVSAARWLGGARSGIAARLGQQARADRLQQLRSTPNGQRATNASHLENPRNGLRQWSDRRMADDARRAQAAWNSVSDRVLRTAPSTPLDRIPHLDHDLAESAADLRRLSARTDLSAAERASLAGVRGDITQARRVNAVGLALQTGDVGDTGGSTGVLRSGAAWKESSDDSASRALWRLGR